MTGTIVVIANHGKAIARFTALAQKAYQTAMEFNWPAGSFIILTPFLAAYGLYTTPVEWFAVVVNIIVASIAEMSVTTGYHRLWSHQTFDTIYPMKVIFALCGTAAFSMSVIDWAKDHRTHHKYTDTDKDPYNAKFGLWYSHIGWLLKARDMPNADVRDLEAEPLLRFQHKFYVPLAFILGWGLPVLMSGLWSGDWWGGFYVSCVRIVILHHIIFSINSFAHYKGGQPYASDLTPRENFWLAILTFGEGYHNFHHEFPNDYRNGIHWNAWDPTKWLIALLEYFDMAWGLKRTPDEVIAKSKIQTLLNLLIAKREKFFWGKPISSLPQYTKEQVEREITEKNASLVIMGNIVYDVADFMPMHPGGDKILRAHLGKDIAKEFNGGVYRHTSSAKYLLDTLRVGVLSTDEPGVRCSE